MKPTPLPSEMASQLAFTPLLFILMTTIGCLDDPRYSDPVTAPGFTVEETTIAEIHQAMSEGRLTARRLVELYLARIDAYDKQGIPTTPYG